MKKQLSLFLLIGGILVLCLSFRFSKEAEAETTFPETKALHGRTIPIDTALFKYPWRIRVNGDRAVVEDLHGPDYFFHLFSYPDFRYLSSFSKRGEGPEEMLQAENFRWEGEYVWTLDGNKSEMVQWQFNARRDSLLRHRVVKLQKELFRALDFTIYSGTRFLIPDYSGDNRFCWVDRQGKLIRKTGTIPSSDKKALQESRHALAYAWRSFIDYNPHNGVLVAATQLGDVLEVYNLKKNTHMVKVGGQGEPQFMVSRDGYGVPTSNSLLAIQNVTTSCGCTKVEYRKEPVRPGESIELKVSYEAEEKGYFEKIITVFANVETSSVRLRVRGNAE